MTTYHQNESTLEIIGRNIRRWREFREMSGETLACAVKTDKSQISKIENGRIPDLCIRTIEEMAKALGLTLEQLLFTSPQTIIALTQSRNSNGINHGPQNNVDAALVAERRQPLKAKDDHIKFLQAQFPSK